MRHISNVTAYEMISEAMHINIKTSPGLSEYAVSESLEVEYLGVCDAPKLILYAPEAILKHGMAGLVANIAEMYYEYVISARPLCSLGAPLSDTPTMQ